MSTSSSTRKSVEIFETEHTELDAKISNEPGQPYSLNTNQESTETVVRNVSSSYSDAYPRQGDKRLALVFNHLKFQQSMNKERNGTQVDKNNIYDCFKKYKFYIEPLKDDMKKAEVQEKLKEVAARDHTDTDCLVVIVLTHGNWKGELSAFDDWYSQEELISSFTSNNCPSLTGKPKLFFIQACRGEKTSVAARTINVQADFPTDSKVFSIPEEADILVFYSTYEGRVSYRDTTEGSWFIQELCAELNRNGEKDDLLSMLTRVNSNVAARRVRISGIRERKQMPVIQSSLTRKFYFCDYQHTTETDISRKLSEIHASLEKLCHESNTPKETPTPPRKPLRKSLVEKDWENLHPSTPVVSSASIDNETVLQLGTYLKMFLNYEGSSLSDEAADMGNVLLSHLSNWRKLENDTRKFVYEHVIKFFVKNARKWQFFNVLKISPHQIANIQQRGKSRSDSLQSVSSDKK